MAIIGKESAATWALLYMGGGIAVFFRSERLVKVRTE